MLVSSILVFMGESTNDFSLSVRMSFLSQIHLKDYNENKLYSLKRIHLETNNISIPTLRSQNAQDFQSRINECDLSVSRIICFADANIPFYFVKLRPYAPFRPRAYVAAREETGIL